jgi:transmembrane sensor
MNDVDTMSEPEANPIRMQGLAWFVVMNDSEVSAKDRLAFDNWLDADPAHQEAYERAQALWQRFDVVIPEYTRLKRQGALNRRKVLLAGLAAIIGAPTVYVLSDPILFAEYSTDVA